MVLSFEFGRIYCISLICDRKTRANMGLKAALCCGGAGLASRQPSLLKSGCLSLGRNHDDDSTLTFRSSDVVNEVRAAPPRCTTNLTPLWPHYFQMFCQKLRLQLQTQFVRSKTSIIYSVGSLTLLSLGIIWKCDVLDLSSEFKGQAGDEHAV